MCGRFTLTTRDVHELARALRAEVDAEAARLHRPRWNVAPTDEHWIVVLDRGGRRVLRRARFGVEVQRDRLVINARSETAASLPTFRAAFQGGRCLVPADGFYEWKGDRSERRPCWLHPTGGGLLLLAGLVLDGQGPPGFVILTTAANHLVSPLHDRMPALLTDEGASAWLARPDGSLLAPAPEDWLAARDVSAKVNAVANDGPDLLERPAPTHQLKLL